MIFDLWCPFREYRCLVPRLLWASSHRPIYLGKRRSKTGDVTQVTAIRAGEAHSYPITAAQTYGARSTRPGHPRAGGTTQEH